MFRNLSYPVQMFLFVALILAVTFFNTFSQSHREREQQVEMEAEEIENQRLHEVVWLTEKDDYYHYSTKCADSEDEEYSSYFLVGEVEDEHAPCPDCAAFLIPENYYKINRKE